MKSARLEGIIGVGRQGSVLGSDSGAAGERVKSNSFAKKDFADGTADCGTVVDWAERRAL